MELTVDRALYRLMHHRSFRTKFVRGELGKGQVPSALATIDKQQLEEAAKLVLGEVWRRSHRGTGTLLDAFPRTIAAFPGARDDLAADFLESPHFERFRALPTCKDGLSLEEAFFRFAEDIELGDAATRRSECVHALIRALAVTPKASFERPSFIHAAPGGHFAILDEGPTLVAAVSGRFVTGELTTFLAALLLASDADAPGLAKRFGVDAAELQASCDELGAMGLR